MNPSSLEDSINSISDFLFHMRAMSINSNEKVEKLLRLLEAWLMKRGDLLVSYDTELAPPPSNATTSAWMSAIDNLPPALRICPRVSLNDHLRQLEEETAIHEHLGRVIGSMMLEEQTVAAAIVKLQMEAQRDGLLVPEIEDLALPELLIALRTSQQRGREAAAETFAIKIVTRINQVDGSVAEVMEYHLSASTDWEGLQRFLKDMTTNWQAGQAGFRHGYCLADGKWMYQTSFKDTTPDRSFRDLTSEVEYEVMRKILRSPDKGVLIWHELQRQQAEGFKEELEELCDFASESSDQEPLDDDETPMFDSIFSSHIDLAGEVDIYMSKDRTEASEGQGASEKGLSKTCEVTQPQQLSLIHI